MLSDTIISTILVMGTFNKKRNQRKPPACCLSFSPPPSNRRKVEQVRNERGEVRRPFVSNENAWETSSSPEKTPLFYLKVHLYFVREIKIESLSIGPRLVSIIQKVSVLECEIIRRMIEISGREKMRGLRSRPGEDRAKIFVTFEIGTWLKPSTTAFFCRSNEMAAQGLPLAALHRSFARINREVKK